MKMFDTIKSSALGAAIGAYSTVNDVIGKLARSDSLQAVLTFIMERLQDEAEMGSLTRCDAGKVAPAVLRTLETLRHAASKQSEWIIRQFLAPRMIRALIQPDPMDLVFAMQGLQEAARTAASEVWAIERTLRHRQNPLAPLVPGAPRADDVPSGTVADPWRADEYLEDTAAQPAMTLTATDIAATALWLEQRIRYVTTRNLARIQEELVTLYGEQLADPLAVTAALAELRALTAFTSWLAHRIQHAAWRAVMTQGHANQ